MDGARGEEEEEEEEEKHLTQRLPALSGTVHSAAEVHVALFSIKEAIS